jgi:hypothetical protein
VETATMLHSNSSPGLMVAFVGSFCPWNQARFESRLFNQLQRLHLSH